jgi:signal transduction histidine kinase
MQVRNGVHLKWLIAAFSLIAAVFVASAAVTYGTISGMDEHVADLNENSLPSVTQLSRARVDLQRARLLADELTLGPDGWSEQRMRDLRSHEGSIRARLVIYEGTPWYPNEHELYVGTLLPALEKLQQATARLERDGQGAPQARIDADFRFDSAASEVDEALTDLIDMNQSHAYVATRSIVNARRSYDHLVLLLTIVSAGVAAAAATAALRLLRRQQRLGQEAFRHESARAAELEMFASRVGHDLLSPLAGVTLSLGSIARQHDDPATHRAITRAERMLERSRAMVQAIYDFARAGARPAGEARASLRAAARGAVDEIAVSGPEPTPEVNVEPFEDVELECAPGVLDTILSNLLGNAAKCMRDSSVRRITVRALVVGKRARVEVEDTGPGVPSDLEPTVFDPYVRAPSATEPGLGLGLATVKRLVDCHGGSVGVRRASAHEGAVFWFELPLGRPKASGAALPAGVGARLPAS